MSCPDAPAATIVNSAIASERLTRSLQPGSFTRFSPMNCTSIFTRRSRFGPEASVYRTPLDCVLGRQRKSRLRLGAVQKPPGHVLPYRRAMLEPVSRSAARKPDVFHSRMPVNQKISARSVLILADSRFHDRGILQGRESPRHVRSNPFPQHRRNNPGLRVRINTFAMAVICNLQSPALNVRHSVEEILLKQPGRQRRRSKPRIARGYSKEKNFLPRREDARPQNFRKHSAKPCSASKHEFARHYAFALACYHRFLPPGSCRF